MIRTWTVAELSRLSHAERVELCDLLGDQMVSPTRPVAARRWAAEVLARLAKVGGVTMSDRAPTPPSRVPPAAPVEGSAAQRVADAKAFLYGQQDAATAERLADAKLFLRPGEAERHELREEARAFRETPPAGATPTDGYGQQDGRSVAQRVADARAFLAPPAAGKRRGGEGS